MKEAQQSVLAPFAGASDYSNQGQRVVVGQRTPQAATDVFLGWTQTPIELSHFDTSTGLRISGSPISARAWRNSATILRVTLRT